MMHVNRSCRGMLLTGTMLVSVLAASPAWAEDAAPDVSDGDDIIVTATRRSDTVQNVPINIAAVTDAQLQTLRAQDISEISRTVPGIYIVDTGQRAGNTIVFRGLNADPLGSNDGDNSGGGTVAIYFGEIPLYADFRANDMERVEFLIGPQGTLYGAGTLGGAVRYIPKRPQFDAIGGEVRADLYNYKHGDGISTDTGMTVNVPLTPTFAFRGSIDYLNDRGFIDQPYALRANQVGLANPNDFANTPFTRLKDVNYVDTISARAAVRWQPVEAIDLNLTYYYQRQETGGRQLSSYRLGQVDLLDSNGDTQRFPAPLGKYDSAMRIAEPNTRKNQLLALEAYIDLDFAELTSATGYSKFTDKGSRDQTDLLITLEYSYEAFPEFTARTLEEDKQETWMQEVRLVSKSEGPFNWIVGGFYNRAKSSGYSKEFTPYLDVYYGTDYPENLEYYSVGNSKLTEMAAYGELGYEITPQWQVTVGGRYYNYKSRFAQAVDLPLYDVAFGGRDPGVIILDYEDYTQKDDGFLWKVNTSYKITPDAMVYGTVSKGYRIGGRNPLNLCENTGENQNVCAQPDELEYSPDETTNYEVGFKTQWFNRKVTLNGAFYYIDWSNPQLSSATLIGSQPITKNGAGARTMGMELSGGWQITPELSIRGNFAYTDPELTNDSPSLLTGITTPGFGTGYATGLKGDRLPGSPKYSGNVFVDYRHPVGNDMAVGFTYKLRAQSNVVSRTGGRDMLQLEDGTTVGGSSYTLGGFATHGAALTFEYRGFNTQLYVDNIFDKYAEVGVRSSPAFAQAVFNQNGDSVYVRSFGTFPIAPRVIGIRSTLSF